MPDLLKEYKNQKLDIKISMIAKDFALLRHAVRKIDKLGNDLLLDNPTDEEEVGIFKKVKIENREIMNYSAKAIRKMENIQDILRNFIKNF